MSETSPAGEAGSANGGDDNNSTECPTCGHTDFKNAYGMKIHHKQVHGESIAGELVECDWCAESFRRAPAEASGTNYCSNECMGQARSEQYSGKSHPRWNGGKATISCEWCGSDYDVWPAVVDDSRFCSTDCKSEWQSENLRGENHHLYNSVKVDCHICGETVERKPSHLEEQENVYCSYECHREYQSRHQVGENHHNYAGGRTEDYGPRWEKRAEKRRELDNHTCQLCGVTQEEHYQALSVHHLRPRSDFMDEQGNYDHEQGNRLENLITLCTSCHKRWEGIPLRPQ